MTQGDGLQATGCRPEEEMRAACIAYRLALAADRGPRTADRAFCS
jgi:hypothetical protein